MFLFLILPILVSGFICCHILPAEKLKLHRYEGQYLYLKSAKYGITCLFISILIILLLNRFVPPKLGCVSLDFYGFLFYFIEPLIVSDKPESVTWILIFSFSTLLCPWLLRFAANIMYRREFRTDKVSEMLTWQILNDSPLDALLYKSVVSKSNPVPLMLSLSDKKVYVGNISSMGEPNENEGMDQEIVIIPIMSGYRDKETLEVEFTTYYDKEKDKNLFIVIKQDLISYATVFDFDTYSRLNDK